jgi:hypothetical protein
LVLKKQVEKGVALLKPDAIKKVALGTGEVGINKRAGLQLEGTPIQGAGDLRREVVFEKTACVFRDREGGLEEFVVGLVKAVFGHQREWKRGIQKQTRMSGRPGMWKKHAAGDCSLLILAINAFCRLSASLQSSGRSASTAREDSRASVLRDRFRQGPRNFAATSLEWSRSIGVEPQWR